MPKVIRYILLFFSISMFVIGILFSNYDVLLGAICSLFIHNLWYSCEKFSERIIFFTFNIAFFTFLVGRLVVKLLTNYKDIYNNNEFGLDFNSDVVISNIFIILFVSLLFLFLGYSVMEQSNKKMEISRLKGTVSGVSIESIAFISKTLFYFTFIFNVIVLLDKARFTSEFGYEALYALYASSTTLPFGFIKIAEMCPTALFVYLGTLPTKRKSLLPLMLYLFLGVLSLVVGNRNDFVLNILIIIVYFCLRNITDRNEVWFGKKEIMVSICAFPVLVLLLNAVSYMRVDNTMTHISVLDVISEFFYAQGVSVNLIGYAQTLANQLPEGTIYTFGKITDFIRNNTLTQLLFDVPKYAAQSVESALYGSRFSDSVSYILSPNAYINGWGYGSSYVAELYKDFGYIGVIMGNFALGIILVLMNKFFRKGVFGVWLSLSMTRLLLHAPRDTFMSFFVTTFSLINILTLFLILLGAIIIGRKKHKISSADCSSSFSYKNVSPE